MPCCPRARRSIVKGVPLGCTLHQVSDVLDDGAWSQRGVLDVREGMSFDDVVHASCVLAGRQALRALEEIAATGALHTTPFEDGSAGPNFKWSDTIERRARDVLAAGSYPLLLPRHGEADKQAPHPEDLVDMEEHEPAPRRRWQQRAFMVRRAHRPTLHTRTSSSARATSCCIETPVSSRAKRAPMRRRRRLDLSCCGDLAANRNGTRGTHIDQTAALSGPSNLLCELVRAVGCRGLVCRGELPCAGTESEIKQQQQQFVL